MRKGITPIISIIILLLITIALAGVAYSFLMGQMFTRIAGSFDIPTGGAFCTNNRITVQVVNTGTATLDDTDFTIVRVNGANVESADISSFSIEPGDGAVLLDNYDCGGSCNTGANNVDLSTAQAALQKTVYCA